MIQSARRVFVSLAAFILTATAAIAVDDSKIIFPGSSASGGAPAPGGAAGLGSVTLLVGLALAAVGAWLVWRSRIAAPAGRDVRQLAVTETRSLGNRQFLVVASYEDKKFLLGVCPGRIDFLAPLHDPSDSEKPPA